MESHEKTVHVVDLTRDGEDIEMRIENGIKPKQLKDLDDLFPYIGGFGWFQRMLFLLMIPYSFFFAFVYFSQIFMTLVPAEHWCNVPELRNLSVELRRHLSIPQTQDLKYERCLVYDVNWEEILSTGNLEPNPTWPTKKCTGKWEFNFTDIPYETIATQLDWVCDRDEYPATAQAVFFCGAIVGGLIFGWIADKFGRIPAIVGTNMVGFLAGVGTAFANSFWSFCICRFLVGLAYDNCFMVMYIVVVEYVGPKWRTFVANMSIAVYFTFAACMLPWIALAVADWKIYTLITSVPLVLSILTPCVVPESARWLISQGRIEEALKIIQKCERVNRRKIPDEILKEFRETATEIAKAEEELKAYSFLDLFRTPRLRRHTILLLLIWMSIAMVFDGHVRNVGSLGLDMFVTFTIATATEFPADVLLILTLDIVGRRWLAFGSMVMSGVFSFLATTVPFGLPSATLAIIGRFAVNISFNIGMQYAAELLPTVVRAQGLALIHITGYVATILVPYIVYLATIAAEIPLLILGTIGIFGGCLCLFLPESMGKDMPQTILDGEEYGKHQKFWDVPCFKRKVCDAVESRKP
ncbi:carcinine transporter-like [Leptidea sinapis]|uniref:carcinine transporter-like n=1 Tax=Leptidea sinapis TaxID=189913 RepID=UPI0021318BF8|nr:carcinine transporter-like [Leptidea sinapis]XP_050678262.1 carcinine transporter-like [Leptidea sinapis]